MLLRMSNGDGWLRGRVRVNTDHVQTVVGIAGRVEVPALQWAVDHVHRAYPRLLRGFGCDGSGRQISFQACETPRVREVDLRECSAFECEGAALRLEEHERREEFALGAPPLIRFLLIRLGDREQRLVVTNHRTVMDDWSHVALVRAIFRANGWDVSDVGTDVVDREARVDRVAPAVGGDDGSQLAVGAVGGQERDAAVAWRREFDDWGASPMPDAFGPVSGDGERLLRVTRELSADLTRRILDRAAEYSVDAETIVQCVWAVALGELTGRRDVLFGGVVPASSAGVWSGVEAEAETGAGVGVGRTLGSRILGVSRDIVPIPIRLRPDRSVMELALAVKACHVRLAAHPRLGPGELLTVVGPRASFGTVAQLAPELIRPIAPRLGMRIRTLSIFDVKPYPLSFSVTSAMPWTVRLDCRAQALPERVARGALGSAVAAIEAIAYAPGIPVGRIGSFSADGYSAQAA